MTNVFNRHNFHKNTFCIFSEVGLESIENLKPNYKSKSGSVYYFSQDGVYRLSNHWGRAAKCKWRLQSNNTSANRSKLGFALWSSFHRDNDYEKLYYIEMHRDGVHFQHKDNGNCNGEILRSAPETTARVRQIRNLIENDGWTKYYPNENPETLKEKVINEMIATDKTFVEIKKNYEL